LREKVVTPHTAYIVLERIEDYVKYNITPPAELAEECKRINYVKRDTRFQRQQITKMDEYDIINRVVDAYNNRIRKWDPKEPPISLTREEYKLSMKEYPGTTENTSQLQNLLQGKVPGISVTSESSLGEVVVTAYGTRQRKQLSGAIAYVSSLNMHSFTSVEQVLQGRVAGVEVTSGSPGSAAAVKIRGASSFSANNNSPLFVLDGMPISGNINDLIRVGDIDYISVLKGPEAGALYGSRAANGAIVVVSKKGSSYNGYRNNRKPYRLKDMEDMEYVEEIKAAPNEEKLDMYESLRQEWGAGASYYFDVAEYFHQLGWRDTAYEVLMNAAEVSAGNRQAQVAMGYILESWRFFSDAITIYQQLAEDQPEDIAMQRNLALVYYQCGNHQQSVDLLFKLIKMNTGAYEVSNTWLKTVALNELNAIVAVHKDKVDCKNIARELIRPLPVDLRVTIECNKPSSWSAHMMAPHDGLALKANYALDETNPFNYVGQGNIVEYNFKSAKSGRHKIVVNYYDHYLASNIPTIIRTIRFKNFGRNDQSIEIENAMMDNQNGEIEIGEIKMP
jgi:TonB-dependent SusC/RagA subfamily outer membrane receptor